MGWNETLILWLLKSGRVAITIYLKKCIKARGERSEEERRGYRKLKPNPEKAAQLSNLCATTAPTRLCKWT